MTKKPVKPVADLGDAMRFCLAALIVMFVIAGLLVWLT